ncbi:hypothetical protein KIW84_054516 [Lathyrus oleraceus]|uniref:Chromo domain-containing protein n=1 Tax=Pisum sativum TaxID=3888 RepID=A0A9D5AID0_PEA|nr:hypothetical protein KIW84_054516 [Pisum sativum]
MSLKLCENSSDEEEETGGIGVQTEELVEVEEEFKTLQLSMQSKQGFTSNKYFKMMVTVMEKKLVTLIDSGATSNFIDAKLVEQMGLKLVETPPYVIEVGNGERVKYQGICNIEANFAELSLKWASEGQKHNIQGGPFLCTKQASMKAMIKALHNEGMGFFLQSLQAEEQSPELTEWEEVLISFEKVFNLPARLPPIRKHDHAIRLKDEADIPNLRPYSEAQETFEKLKMDMTTIPILAMLDFDKEFVVETDASGQGIGVVLMQGGKPICYMSQTLSDRAQQKSVYERELMAIVITIQKWRPYLLGRHFKIHTDQKSLKFITEQRIMGGEQQKWLSKLLGFDFEVKYKPGKENSAADSLSRHMQYAHITTIQCEAWEGLEEEIRKDDKLRSIVQTLISDPASQKGFQLKGGRLYHEGRVVIPRNSPRISWILNEFHDTAVGGHSGAPPVLIRGDIPGSAIDEVNKLTMERNLMIKELQKQLLRAQDLIRSQANKHRREVEYEVEDMVFVKIQPYKMKKLAKRLNQKLSPRYYGPYEVIQRIGVVAYKLKFPEGSKVHPVFHASLLIKAVIPVVEPQPLPSCMNEEWQLEPMPEKVISDRRNKQGELEVLVKWKNLPEFENSWELAEKM